MKYSISLRSLDFKALLPKLILVLLAVISAFTYYFVPTDYKTTLVYHSLYYFRHQTTFFNEVGHYYAKWYWVAKKIDNSLPAGSRVVLYIPDTNPRASLAEFLTVFYVDNKYFFSYKTGHDFREELASYGDYDYAIYFDSKTLLAETEDDARVDIYKNVNGEFEPYDSFK